MLGEKFAKSDCKLVLCKGGTQVTSLFGTRHFHQARKTNDYVRENIKRHIFICKDKAPTASLSKVGNTEIIIHSFFFSLDNIHYIS